MGDSLREVVVKPDSAAQALAAHVAPGGHGAQQVERSQLGERDRGRDRGRQRGRAIDKKVRNREAQRPTVYARGDAGVEHPASAGIEVGAQFRVVVGKGRELQHGYQRRQPPSLGKRESGE